MLNPPSTSDRILRVIVAAGVVLLLASLGS
jgi:hypothetical protein